MRNIVVLCLMIVIGAGVAFAQDDEADGIGIAFDGGAGLSIGLFPPSDSDNELEGALTGIVNFLSTLRGALYGNARYEITEQLSVGGRLGLYAITFGEGESASTLVDLPMHLLVSYNLGGIGIEGFGGFYLSAVSTPEFNYSGAEIGAKVILGGLYGSLSQVFAATPFQRVELGFELTNVFKL